MIRTQIRNTQTGLLVEAFWGISDCALCTPRCSSAEGSKHYFPRTSAQSARTVSNSDQVGVLQRIRLNHSHPCRTAFVQPSNYSIIMYQQPCPSLEAGFYQHLHLAASPIVTILNAPNYQALMGFAQGNLIEISSYDKDPEGTNKEKPQQRTKFNPDLQFAPPRNEMPNFRMTANIPKISVSLLPLILQIPLLPYYSSS